MTVAVGLITCNRLDLGLTEHKLVSSYDSTERRGRREKQQARMEREKRKKKGKTKERDETK